jgi:hypothetical protein
MSKKGEIIKRLDKLESSSKTKKYYGVIHDLDAATYEVEGKSLSQQEYDQWYQALPENAVVWLVEISVNKPTKTGFKGKILE